MAITRISVPPRFAPAYKPVEYSFTSDKFPNSLAGESGITHDQEEALEVADQIVVMNHGHVEQIGSPQQVYDAPATPFVYQFLGNINLFHSRVHAGWARVGGLRMPVPEYDDTEHAPAMAYVRPHDIDLLREPEDNDTTLAATINRVSQLGSLVRLELTQMPGGEVAEVEMTRERYAADPLQTGDLVVIKPRQWRVFLRTSPLLLLPILSFLAWQWHVTRVNGAMPDWTFIPEYRKLDDMNGWYFGRKEALHCDRGA